MDQVPKILKPMVAEWTPEGFVVSFKLETDQSLLIPKARISLERYGHQVVIGNELHRRKLEVVFVSRVNGKGAGQSQSQPHAQQSAEEAPNANGVEQLDGVNARKKRRIENGSGSVEVDVDVAWLRLDERAVAEGKEIEDDIIAELVKRHTLWIEQGA
jgi:phosphopantothenate-cysteine ligase